jgi:uncharacterized protein DUF5906
MLMGEHQARLLAFVRELPDGSPFKSMIPAAERGDARTIRAFAEKAAGAKEPPPFAAELLELARLAEAPLSWNDVVATLNKRWFLVDVEAETVVGEEIAEASRDGSRRWTRLSFRKFDAFKRHLVKAAPAIVGTKDKGSPVYQHPADIWLKSPAGRQYGRLVYAPEGSDVEVRPGDLNGWKGFTVRPAEGVWSRVKAFVRDVVCDGDDRLFEWTLDWMAALFREPGRHAESALALVGAEGVGKNFFVEQILAWTLDGRHASTVVGSAAPVLGDFNDRLSGLVLLALDEVRLTDAQSAALRGVVTADYQDINRKHIPRSKERSMLHVALLSNREDDVLRMNKEDRRYAVYKLPDSRRNDHAYFKALADELANGGRAAMLAELLAREPDWDALRFPPSTRAKDALRLSGLDGRQTALLNWLMAGSFRRRVPKEGFFAELRGRNDPTDPGWSNVALGRMLAEVFPNGDGRQKLAVAIFDGSSSQVPAFDFGGGLDECRAAFEQWAGVRVDWDAGGVLA